MESVRDDDCASDGKPALEPQHVGVLSFAYLAGGCVMRALLAISIIAMLGACATADPPAPPKARVIVRTVDRVVPVDRVVTVDRIVTVATPAAPLPMAVCEPEKRTCAAMASCAEAMHYLGTCGVSSLDGGAGYKPDRVACQRLCGDDVRAMCTRVRNAPHFLSGGRLSQAATPAACATQ